MIKIAFYDAKAYDKPSFIKYGQERGIEFKFFDYQLNEDTVALTKGFDGVCCFVNDNINKGVIEELNKNNIHMIALRCAGFNNVDLSAAFGKVHVYRVPAYSPYAVAEHAIAMLLTMNRRIHKAYIRTREYNFSLNGLTGVDLHDKTMGVIGTGKIGQIFINICKGFGMHIVAYDKFPNPNLDIEYVSLEELYKRSDFISLHCPLTEENRHMIDKSSMEMMKKGVGIINTSRGGLINANDLLDEIKARKVGFAALDVYEEESDIFFQDKSGHILDDDILRSLIAMPNVLLTSHQAFLTEEALLNIADTTTQNIVNHFKDLDEVNPNEVCYHCPNINNCRRGRHKKCF